MKYPLILGTAFLVAAGAQGALVFNPTLSGGTDSWTMAGGGTMTTQDLSAAFTTSDPSLNFLITGGTNTDAASGSFSAWFKLPAGAADNLVMVKSVNGTTASISNFSGYSLSTDTSGVASLNQTGNSAPSLATIAQGSWNLVTLTVQKESSNRLLDVELYVNGLLWGGGSTPTDTVAGSNLNGNNFLGLIVGQSGMSIGGLQVYNNVLTPANVSNLYSAQVATVPEPSACGLAGAGLLAGMATLRRRRSA